MKKMILLLLLVTLNAIADGQTFKNTRKLPAGLIHSRIEQFIPYASTKEFGYCLTGAMLMQTAEDADTKNCSAEVLKDTDLEGKAKVTCLKDGKTNINFVTIKFNSPNDQVSTIEDLAGNRISIVTQHYVSPCK